jgi:hypothetical protein
MAKLTQHQQELLDYVAETDERFRQAKRHARRRAQEMVEQEIAMFSAARDKAVWEAVNAGVPKRQVGILGLGTTSPNTVHEVFDRAVANMKLTGVELAVPKGPRYSWGHIAMKRGDGLFAWVLDAEDPFLRTEGLDSDFERRENDGHYVNILHGKAQNTTDAPDAVKEWAVQHYTELPDTVQVEESEDDFEVPEEDAEREDWS